tara:strand:- start:590 stop:1105 length:516 start_codon:yes stop_codon:yes gene_type:complete
MNFEHWATGNLVDNRNRGIFAEWLVGQALDIIKENDFRTEWDAVDFYYGDLKIEVKASGRSQSWNLNNSTTPRFGIPQQKRAWFAKSDTWIVYDKPERSADVYVFCLHEPVPATNENVKDPNSWRFWVIATSRINDELNTQSSVGISTLNQLTEPVSWSAIKEKMQLIEKG